MAPSGVANIKGRCGCAAFAIGVAIAAGNLVGCVQADQIPVANAACVGSVEGYGGYQGRVGNCAPGLVR